MQDIGSVLDKVNTAALVLGYLVIFLLLAGVAWFLAVRHDAWRYARRRKRQHDIEWDNLRSAWIFDMHRTDTIEAPAVKPDRITTDVLEFTVDQIYDYQKEYRSDAS